MPFTLHGYSTALFSSWYFLEEIGVLFDCGDGCTSHLLQKSRKIKHIFISHPDRDHLGGLLQLNQLNARGDFPIVYYPADSSSFPRLYEFSVKFDPQVSFPEWKGIVHGTEISVHPDYVVKAIRNEHVPVSKEINKSLSFILYRKKKKLKQEFQPLTGKEIASLRQKQGDDYISDTILEPVIAYSADTPVERDGRWNTIPVLIHEATFFTKEETDSKETGRNKHSSLEEVMEMAAGSGIQQLILGHFSSRYHDTEIKEKVSELIKKNDIRIPVHLVLPGAYTVINF
jgi:ribonuclease Z